MFPSPCGVLVVKRGFQEFTVGKIMVEMVSVPLRGFGSETRQRLLLPPPRTQVSVPLRGFGSETTPEKAEAAIKKWHDVSVPLRGFGSETVHFSHRRNDLHGKFPSPCGVLVVKLYCLLGRKVRK